MLTILCGHFYFMIHTKVCIIGCGPAGAAAALQLNQEGIDCVVVDKAVFPRDKVCGDGLSGKVPTALKRIDPQLAERLKSFECKVDSLGVSFIAPNRERLDVGFVNNVGEKVIDTPIGYVCKRINFDNFLVEEVKKCPHVQLFQNKNITAYQLNPDGYTVTDSDGFDIKAEMLIIANGAHAPFSKEVAGIEMEPEHFCAGIRAYYKNVSGNHPDNFIELHFLKDLLPGYFWIFPLPNGEANVGLGILSKEARRKKMNLKKELLRIVETDPVLKERFKNAALIGSIDGYGLPLGSKTRKLSGERFLLTGDAGSLIDPFTGEGIGNALYSGRAAAKVAAKAIANNDFSAAGLLWYDKEIERILGQELKLSTRIQKLVRFPYLFNLLLNISARNKKVKELMSCMFYEVDLRKKLTKPSFYINLLLNR